MTEDRTRLTLVKQVAEAPCVAPGTRTRAPAVVRPYVEAEPRRLRRGFASRAPAALASGQSRSITGATPPIDAGGLQYEHPLIADDLYWDPYDAALARAPYPIFNRTREESPLYYNAKHDF
ncbi:hypothetical protein GCM10010182_82500 [Actinomadura cremea]|nr:hypothetical protein GCM10010182_82500 [Actinomadura cremea]